MRKALSRQCANTSSVSSFATMNQGESATGSSAATTLIPR